MREPIYCVGKSKGGKYLHIIDEDTIPTNPRETIPVMCGKTILPDTICWLKASKVKYGDPLTGFTCTICQTYAGLTEWWGD